MKLKQETRNSHLQKVYPLFVAFAYLFPTLAAAAFTSPIAGDLWSVLEKIIVVVVYIMFPILVLMLVYTGFLFVSAQGNPGKLEEAKRAFIWTLIGSFVVLGAQALAMAIKSTAASLAP